MQTDLSATERRILEMMVGNMSMSEIAFALDVETFVVTKACEHIFHKLEVSDPSSAAEMAAKLKLVKLEP